VRHRSIKSQQTNATRWDFLAPGGSLKTRAQTQQAHHNSLKVGDHVVPNVPGFNWNGVVIEDRGNLGIDGGQIVMIRIGDEDEVEQFEIRADDLDRVAA
jgi:hypothetical protein